METVLRIEEVGRLDYPPTEYILNIPLEEIKMVDFVKNFVRLNSFRECYVERISSSFGTIVSEKYGVYKRVIMCRVK